MKTERLPTLRHVKFVSMRGHLYAYFNLGNRQGKRLYAPLPRYGSEEFYGAYAQLLAVREKPSRLSFIPDDLETQARRARVFAESAGIRESERTVYFVQCHTGEIKIGVAFNLKSRLKSLQAAHPHPIKLLAATVGGTPVEKAYHARFAHHRLKGEWFCEHPEILAEIDDLNAGTKHGCSTRCPNRA